jgi:hypothetical protein
MQKAGSDTGAFDNCRYMNGHLLDLAGVKIKKNVDATGL